ncbi:hypothetical protein ABZY81_23525 [Streptomyces sp. NPDC006514]|uniref:hypothetical protein n=1 Tax=Streptomyces sp. NPDC006514 TaxID=3154308 RepID=UPI0033A5ED80
MFGPAEAGESEHWTATQVGELDFPSFLENAARQLRVGVVHDLIVKREVAAELRAYRLQDALMEEHRRVVSVLTREAVVRPSRVG